MSGHFGHFGHNFIKSRWVLIIINYGCDFHTLLIIAADGSFNKLLITHAGRDFQDFCPKPLPPKPLPPKTLPPKTLPPKTLPPKHYR